MAKKYYVVGGHYTDTDWKELIKGTEEKHGPFTKKRALEVWQSRSWNTVDTCCYRFRVIPA